jgi:C-terminal processing protease CtpA/Prc
VFAGGRGDAGDVDGILGLDVLRQFNLSTDPRTSSLWVQPFEAPPSEDRYGLSGLWLDQADIGARVAAVGWGSPAATAGLVVGDRIVGEPFLSMLRKISGSAGTKVTLTVLRSGTARPLTFTLAPFL